MGFVTEHFDLELEKYKNWLVKFKWRGTRTRSSSPAEVAAHEQAYGINWQTRRSGGLRKDMMNKACTVHAHQELQEPIFLFVWIAGRRTA